MSNDLNQCNFIGRLGKDVEIKYMPSGSAVAEFSIAVGEQWKDKNSGEKQERTEWVNITAFGKLAEICGEYLKKGSQVLISGKLHTDKWEKEGVTHYKTKIIANQMQMLGGRPNNQSTAKPAAHQSKPESNNQSAPADDGFNDDIPF